MRPARVAGGEEGWYDLARYAQAVLGAAMVPLAFLLGLAFLPVWAAILGALFTALSPHLPARGIRHAHEGLPALQMVR